MAEEPSEVARIIRESGLSARARNILASMKLGTVGQMRRLDRMALLKQRSCGQVTAKEILEFVEQLPLEVPTHSPASDFPDAHFRDAAAIMCMAAILLGDIQASISDGQRGTPAQVLSGSAFLAADALLAERRKRGAK